MTLIRIITASALSVAAMSAHAGGVLTGNTLSFPVTSAWQVERQWPASGIVCNSTGGAVSCDLEPGDYTWRDWTDGTSDNVTVAASSAPAPEGNLPVAPTLSIEYVSSEGGIRLTDSGMIDGLATTFSAGASCPAGSVLTGITRCEALFYPNAGDPVPFPAQFSAINGVAACFVHRPDATAPFVPATNARRLDIFVQAACMSID